LYRCRGGRLLRAGLPPFQADPGRRGAREGTAAPSARARSRQPGGGDAAGYRGPGTGQLAAASPGAQAAAAELQTALAGAEDITMRDSGEGADKRGKGVALALGGGSARGLAHVLILEAFDELGVKPCVIVGTSMGAICGAAYAAGLSGADMRAHFMALFAERASFLKHFTGKLPGS